MTYAKEEADGVVIKEVVSRQLGHHRSEVTAAEADLANDVIDTITEARKRQGGSITMWQLRLLHHAERTLGLRNKRNEPTRRS